MSVIEYFRPSQLVDLIHQNTNSFGVFHPGYRGVHGNGRFYAGTFTPTPQAKAFSRALHLQDDPVPFTSRFSFGSGNVDDAPNGVVAMATRFYLPDGTYTNLIGIRLPAFPVRTPQDVIELLTATRPEESTGQPDEERVQRFVADHPAAARIAAITASQAAPRSFAQTSYRPLHAFRFVNASGDGRWAKYHWEPQAGVAEQSLEDLRAQGTDGLFAELDGRIAVGPAVFRLELQPGEESDPVDDVTAIWPDDRERVLIGHLRLVRTISIDEIGDPVMNHDPTVVTDGIEVAPGDEIIAARRGVCEMSVADRTGGWAAKSAALAGICPFTPRPSAVHAVPTAS
jgi:catalase